MIFKWHKDGKKTTLAEIDNRYEAERHFRELSKDFFDYLIEKYNHA